MKAAEKLLQEKTQGLEKLNSLMINREIRMIEMKQQLKSFNSTAHMHTENETSKGDESTVG
jgi:hypothetical protein